MQSNVLDFMRKSSMDDRQLTSWVRDWLTSHVSCVRGECIVIPFNERVQSDLLTDLVQFTLGPNYPTATSSFSRKREAQETLLGLPKSLTMVDHASSSNSSSILEQDQQHNHKVNPFQQPHLHFTQEAFDESTELNQELWFPLL